MTSPGMSRLSPYGRWLLYRSLLRLVHPGLPRQVREPHHRTNPQRLRWTSARGDPMTTTLVRAAIRGGE